MQEQFPDRTIPYSPQVPYHRLCRTDRVFNPEVYAREIRGMHEDQMRVSTTPGKARSSADRAYSCDPSLLTCHPIMPENVRELLPPRLPQVTTEPPMMPEPD